MCGIAGVFSTSNARATSVERLIPMMERRGPDDAGYWSDGGRCELGFRRLSILDLSQAGHQPMCTTDERHVLVFNGELYNYVELRDELRGRGVHFQSSGDTEVVLEALVAWGTDALSRFNGMFALALYDRDRECLLLARDHAGMKPLYWMQTQSGLVFASQFNQIVSHPWSEGLHISNEALGLYLRFGYVPAPYALLENSHSMEAGGWLEIGPKGNVQFGRHFEFSPRKDRLSDTRAVEALEDALKLSVRRHLRSDVPVGVFLSGGIDSPLVASEASIQSADLRAFTIGVADENIDESADARRYADELGLTQIVETITADDALQLLEDVVTAYSEPLADFSVFPTLLVSRLASEHVKVVLSGDGGDELFWGYPGRFGRAIEQSRYFGMRMPARLGHIAARRWFNGGSATRDVLFATIGDLYEKMHTVMSLSDLDELFPELPPVPGDFEHFQFDETKRDETAEWVRWNEYTLHLARILLKVDRASMHHSIEVRVPLLDKEVIDVALRTDWTSCLDPASRTGKKPLRSLLGRRVRHQTDEKKGFTVPMHAWLCGPLQEMVEERLLSRSELLGLPFDASALRKMNDRMLAGDRYIADSFWLLLMLVLWEERHLKQFRVPAACA